MKTYCIGALLVLALSSCTGEEPATPNVVSEAAVARIDSTLSAFVRTGRAVGVSALIHEKGTEAYFGAFGYADGQSEVPMDRETIVQIFSMTKPVTGTTLMTLYEEGRFELDDPVSDFIPELAGVGVFAGLDDDGTPILESPRRPMTIRDLGRHTSGITSSPGSPGDELLREADPLNRENTLDDMAARFRSLPLWFHPGERWAYGPSVDIQALLAQRISGRPFDELVRERVLDALGMDQTRYVVPEADLDRFADLFARDEGGALQLVPPEEAHALNTRKWPLTPGGFGLTSTLDDYMRFARMLLGGGAVDGVRILRPETVRLTATNALADSVTERSWLPSKGQVGFGFNFAVRLRPPASEEENNGAVGEFFWDGAASTLFWVDPANELAAVFFVQVLPFDGSLHKDFRDAVYGPVSIAADAIPPSLTIAYHDSVCGACAGWDEAQQPFRLHDSSYYVGTRGLSAILIASDDGHILIDGALPSSAPLILNNIRALGYDPRDVELILNSHVHFDHAGGIAALQHATGARVAASSRSAPVLESGRSGPDDPQFGVLPDFPAVSEVDRFAPGDTIRVGAIVVASHATGGHTPGGTSWSWQSCDDNGCLEVVYADSQTPISADGFRYTDNDSYPDAIDDFRRGHDTLDSLACNILVTTHPGASLLWDRLAENRLVDANACRRYASLARQALDRRITSETR